MVDDGCAGRAAAPATATPAAFCERQHSKYAECLRILDQACAAPAQSSPGEISLRCKLDGYYKTTLSLDASGRVFSSQDGAWGVHSSDGFFYTVVLPKYRFKISRFNGVVSRVFCEEGTRRQDGVCEMIEYQPPKPLF